MMWFWGKKLITLAFYMKSGNVVRAFNVTDWTINYAGNTITGVDLKWEGNPGLIIQSICLSQIEAVVREK